MKKNALRLVLFVALPILMSSCFEQNTVSEEPRNVVAYFSFGGEITESDISFPGGRAHQDEYTIYGIQVKSITTGGEQHYAYGVFDDLSQLSLTLVEGNQYQAQVTAFQKGTAYGLASYETTQGVYLEMPFDQILENRFIYNIDYGIGVQSPYVNYFNTPDSAMAIGNSHPEIVRYLSQEVYFTGEDSVTVDLHMLRSNFGVQVFADSLTKGNLILDLYDAEDMVITHPDTASEMRILQMSNLYSVDDDSVFSESYIGAVIYHEFVENGDTISNPLFNGNIKFKRNFIKHIFVNVGGDETAKGTDGINITFEDVDFQYDSLYIGG